MQQENVDNPAEDVMLDAAKSFIVMGAVAGFMYGAAWRMENFEKLSHEEIHKAYNTLKAHGLAHMLDPKMEKQIIGLVCELLGKQMAEAAAKLEEQE